jgi:hypothetical protein
MRALAAFGFVTQLRQSPILKIFESNIFGQRFDHRTEVE